MRKALFVFWLVSCMFQMGSPLPASWAWHDETHLAIAKAAGDPKWYNAAGADLTKLKAGKIEAHNHYASNAPGSEVNTARIFEQTRRYNTLDPAGHLYGAILSALRDFVREKGAGKYGLYHLAFCAHYVGDLSQPLHNTVYDAYNKRFHKATDGIVEQEVMRNIGRIRIYYIRIDSEASLAKEIAKIANRSINLGYRLEKEGRLITKREAYDQISQSASLLKAIFNYVRSKDEVVPLPQVTDPDM